MVQILDLDRMNSSLMYRCVTAEDGVGGALGFNVGVDAFALVSLGVRDADSSGFGVAASFGSAAIYFMVDGREHEERRDGGVHY